MNIQPIFSIGVLRIPQLDILDYAAKLYDGRIKMTESQEGKVLTSLVSYDMETKTIDSIKDIPEVIKLVQSIEQNTTIFLNQIGGNTDLYDIKVVNLWLNEMKAGSFMTKHCHYGHVVSGCYYIDVPENSGMLKFSNPLAVLPKQTVEHRELTMYNSSNINFNVQKGDMYLWESGLEHEVPATQFDGVRRSIAFDVNIKRK
jgi:uncharacterized protein (TIGR02466 family)